MTPGEIRRLYFIIRTFLSYGLDELIPKMRITLPLRRSGGGCCSGCPIAIKVNRWVSVCAWRCRSSVRFG